MKTKRIALLSIAATAIATGALLAAAQSSRAFAFAAEVPVLLAWVLTYVWYKEDVAERSVRTSTEFNGLVISLSLVALPIYFIRTRGFIRGMLAAVVFYFGMLLWVVLEAFTAGVALAASAA